MRVWTLVSGGGGEKWSDWGYVLMVELTGPADRLGEKDV